MVLLKAILVFTFASTFAINVDVETPNHTWDALYASSYATGSFSYVALPWTKNEARKKNWVEIGANTRKDNLRYFCPQYDKTVCVIFGSEGDIVGVQLAMSTTDKNVIKLKVGETPFAKKNFDGGSYWTVDVYFSDPVHLKKASMLTTSSMNRETGTGSLVYRKSSLGSSMHVSKDGTSSFPISGNVEYLNKVMKFAKQGCVQERGTHYAYNFFDPSYTCDRIYPIVPVFENAKLVGFSFLVAGTYPSGWFQILDDTHVKNIYPGAPDCFKKYAKQNKFSNIHFRFTQKIPKLC